MLTVLGIASLQHLCGSPDGYAAILKSKKWNKFIKIIDNNNIYLMHLPKFHIMVSFSNG